MPLSANQRLELADPKMEAGDLRRSSVRGAVVTTLSQVAKFALKFGSTAVLARLLTPEDYGLIAMTAVVTGFAALFKDAGLGSATIQRAEITHEQISTLYWINVALGTLIALLLACASPLVAAFYGEPRLTLITCALALSFVLGGATVQHQAILRRQMKFAVLARIEISSTLFGVTTAIVMAAAGLHYWSLVGLTLGTSLCNLFEVHRAAKWSPGKPCRGSGVRQMVRFGTDILSFNIVNYFSRRGDNLLIGWCWGSAALGFYEKAYSLLLLPIGQINGPLTAVALPALSRSRDSSQFARYFLGLLELVAAATIPIVVGLAVFADLVVWVWLGPAWAECANLFRFLSLGALLGALSNPIGLLMMSTGDTGRFRNLGLVNSVVIFASFVLGLPYGAQGVAVSYSAIFALTFIPAWWFALVGKPIRVFQVLLTFLPPALSCGLAAIGALAIMHFGASLSSLVVRSLVAMIFFVVTYACLLLFAFKKLQFYQRLWRDLRLARSAGSRSNGKPETGC